MLATMSPSPAARGPRLPSFVRTQFRPMLCAKPLSGLIGWNQDALYVSRFEYPSAWVARSIRSVVGLALGDLFFREMKSMFGGAW
ncbi:MAG TPA: hypothetical protein VK714_16360 [Myxococcota bacterium]|nr:hypothetical protein [Myxococcota bacterium]